MAEEAKEKDSELQALVNRLKQENEELKKKAEGYQKQFEEADKEKDSWKNKYYEAYADRANTRKQIEKENEDFKKYAQKSLIEELIPTLDSFDRSLMVGGEEIMVKPISNIVESSKNLFVIPALRTYDSNLIFSNCLCDNRPIAFLNVGEADIGIS